MKDDYIPGEKRAPHGTGIAIAALVGIGFWIGAVFAVLAFG